MFCQQQGAAYSSSDQQQLVLPAAEEGKLCLHPTYVSLLPAAAQRLNWQLSRAGVGCRHVAGQLMARSVYMTGQTRSNRQVVLV